ncbi:glycosyltransferase family 2 protein [Pseudomonas sp. RGM2987]|uniref:glycosyltransferase family 2 protein n=1 Tax=Pseudomonas sp. RGM2987 TaxID=2930090 RepID=UPI001FD6C1CE|nr:glycosyltransferase family 2 protein [Pseudomonas sp. RGM2987]MCJ8205254.1 glycosyltransferase family 2 protein [Pseudomonas sp. RGM2987]
MDLGFFNAMGGTVVASFKPAHVDGDSDESHCEEELIPFSPARVSVLLCTFNGARFLKQQLDSIEKQTFGDWRVIVSDDGSVDDTLGILEQYRARWGEGRLVLLKGPKKGFAANFMTLTAKCEGHSKFYAWADQDDVWREDKLERAITWLDLQPSDHAALYCTRTELIDEQGVSIGFSPLFKHPAAFANALVQNIAGGNTMVFNQVGCQTISAAVEKSVVAHDWWAYLAISGVGGRVCYDARPSMLYRQHGGNIIGSNSSLASRITRIRMVFRGRFRRWNETNIAALALIGEKLTPANHSIFDCFKKARQQRGLKRLYWLRRSSVYRQTVAGNLGLLLAAFVDGI